MIYLDHAAATPVNKKAVVAMKPYLTEYFFNPSAAYLPAKKVANDHEKAKAAIAHAVGAKSSDLIITAGATEANNLAFTAAKDGKVLYLATEHDSVRKVAEKYNGEEIKVNQYGVILMDDLKSKLTDDVVLVSISLANNELGMIQPLAEIAAFLRNIKLDRLSRGIKKPLYLHSDASQAMLLTLNSAKVYGPKGVGALYVSHEVKLMPVVVGGGQENGLRSGTENVAGVIGFAAAMEHAKEHIGNNRKKYNTWKKTFLSKLEDYELVNKKHSLDNFIVLCYNGMDAERLIFLLEDEGVYVSTGAACAASKGEKSHVLSAIGLTDSEIAGSLRITMGETNDEDQIREAARIINEVVKKEKLRLKNENGD